MRAIQFNLAGAILLLFAACGKSPPSSPPQAAAQLEQAFANADPSTKQMAAAVSESLRKGEFETAVVTMTTIRSAPAVTPEQHQAIINSAVALEDRLIKAMSAGDKNAERAYQLLKEMKKN